MSEYFDILDENGVKTGVIATRKEAHEKGLWHGAIVVAILNEKNEILLQQRSCNKEKNPGLWDISVAGHISSGQDAISAAVREINEEVTINLNSKITIKDFRFMTSFRLSQIFNNETFIENQFYHFFILRNKNLHISNIKMQEKEVQDVKFVTLLELEELLKTDKIVQRPVIYDILREYLFRF